MSLPDDREQLAENPGLRGQAPSPPAPAVPGAEGEMPADHAAPVEPTGIPADAGARIEPVAPPPQPPPTPAPEAPARPPEETGFEVAGEKWIARPAGIGSYGTGITARVSVQAIHFFRYAQPHHAVREVLTGNGAFASLYDEELQELFRRSRPIVGRS